MIVLVTAGDGASAQTPGSADAAPRPGGVAYVSGGSVNQEVVAVDLDTQRAISSVPVDHVVKSLAVSPDGRTVYASTVEGIVLIDAATMAPIGEFIPVHGGSEIAVSPDGTRAYVANDEFKRVVPIDLTTNSAEPPVLLTGTPNDIVYAPDGATVWVAVEENQNLTPIDVVTDTPGVPIDLGVPPFRIDISPDGAFVYATVYGAGSEEPVLQPVDLGHRIAGPPIALPDNVVAQYVVVAPTGTVAYVTDGSGGQVTPVDLTTRSARPPIPCTLPLGIALTPDGAGAYVTSTGLDNVLIPVDLVRGVAEPGIPVGVAPRDVALFVAPVAPPPATPTPITPTFTG